MLRHSGWITTDRKFHDVKDFKHNDALDGPLGEKYAPECYARLKNWQDARGKLRGKEITYEEYEQIKYDLYDFFADAIKAKGFVRIVVYSDNVYAEGTAQALLNAMPAIQKIAGERKIETYKWEPSSQPTLISDTKESSPLLTVPSAA